MGSNKHILTIDELKSMCGYKSAPDIAAYLARLGIPYFSGKRGHIWTTLEALNMALGVKTKTPERAVDIIEV